MPLTFVDKKKRWPPSKPVQYILAVLALLAAIIVLAVWLYVRFIYTEPTATDTHHDTTQTDIELPGSSYCLIVIEDVGYERFTLVETNPRNDAITVTAVSPALETSDGTLTSILQKHGAARTVQAVATELDVPVSNFLSFSIADVQNLFTKLGENLQCTLPEEVSYRDENGAIVRLTADKRALTPKQITAVLRHTEWKNSENDENVVADLVADLLNQCLLPKRPLLDYFKLLSNTAHTNLRIDNYNTSLSGLEHLASINHGDLAKRTNLTKEGSK